MDMKRAPASEFTIISDEELTWLDFWGILAYISGRCLSHVELNHMELIYFFKFRRIT
ncbi:MAG: hypothetical protein PF483_06115 [Halothiobacillus sp.]|jgi:hypothetical protein|nr:hypothetical protein [Halothiobacillus sp.]